jgi:hypothetical protein
LEFPPVLLAALAMVAGVNGDPNPRGCGRACVRALGKLSSAFARLIFTVYGLCTCEWSRIGHRVSKSGFRHPRPDFPTRLK